MGRWDGISFPWGSTLASLFDVKTDDQVLQSACLNIVMTSCNQLGGERVMMPTFGTNVVSSLFDPNDVFLSGSVESSIRQAIQRWDQRIRVISCSVSKDKTNPNQANVRVVYQNALDPANNSPQELLFTVTQNQFSLFQ